MYCRRASLATLLGLLSCSSSHQHTVSRPSDIQEARSAIVAYHVPPLPGPQVPSVPSAAQNLVSKVEQYLVAQNITPRFRPIHSNLYTASLLPLPRQVGHLKGGLYVCSLEGPLSETAIEGIRSAVKSYGQGASAYRAFLEGEQLRLEEIR